MPYSENFSTKNVLKTSITALLLCAMTLISACSTISENTDENTVDNTGETIIYLVRHAEKVTGEQAGRDPALTQDGAARAKLLADLLSAKNISTIYSSDYIRTRDTAAPLAQNLDLEITIYDPKDLEMLAAKIIDNGGGHLVVGHSNTIPETVTALGGDGGTPIYETSEYDRLYTVTIPENGSVHTILTSYGTPYLPDE
jgi:phosphohistidine phosphatase SixA